MTLLVRMLVVTFIESFATILIERGVFFYTHERLAFTGTENLGVAFGFGLAYVAGALGSHRLAVRWGEKRVLMAAVAGQAAVHALLAAWPQPGVLVASNVALGLLNGVKWPVVESYVMAGQTPAQAMRTVGRFNLAWVTPVPLSVAAAGPLIAWASPALFVLAGALNVASVVLMRGMPGRPVHLAADHPERPDEAALARLGPLLRSSRWSLLVSYSLMWVLAAVVPLILARLAVPVEWSTALSAVLDVARWLAFLVLQVYVGWHGRRGPLVAVVFGLPAGFLLVLFAQNLGMVVAGEVLFGAAAGVTYYAALYYAMVVKNASVEAGGGHEGLIGTGFALGPLAALAGGALGPHVGGEAVGMLLGLGPLVAAGAAGALAALVKRDE